MSVSTGAVRTNLLRASALIAALSFMGFATACAAEAPAEAETDTAAEVTETDASAETEPSSDDADGDGDYAFGTDRDEIAQAIEAAFATQDGTATWEGDTLVLSLDTDPSSPIAGFTECRVLDELLTENDSAMVAFPSERVDCAEVLAG